MKQIVIRSATPEDAEGLLAIYAPYVADTAVSFEYSVPTVEEFAQRIRDRLGTYPWLVAEVEGTVVGYAYASAFHPREAYQWAAEASVYIRAEWKGKGIGKALYGELEERLRKQNVVLLYACIACTDREDDPYLTNDSIRFHEHMRYVCVGEFKKCGYKFDRWYSMKWLEKVLIPRPDHPERFRPAALVEE